MRATVLEDEALTKLAGRFVWLEIDTEKDVNAGFLERYPIQVWPTFLVVDPATERAVRDPRRRSCSPAPTAPAARVGPRRRWACGGRRWRRADRAGRAGRGCW